MKYLLVIVIFWYDLVWLVVLGVKRYVTAYLQMHFWPLLARRERPRRDIKLASGAPRGCGPADTVRRCGIWTHFLRVLVSPANWFLLVKPFCYNYSMLRYVMLFFNKQHVFFLFLFFRVTRMYRRKRVTIHQWSLADLAGFGRTVQICRLVLTILSDEWVCWESRCVQNAWKKWLKQGSMI